MDDYNPTRAINDGRCNHHNPANNRPGPIDDRAFHHHDATNSGPAVIHVGSMNNHNTAHYGSPHHMPINDVPVPAPPMPVAGLSRGCGGHRSEEERAGQSEEEVLDLGCGLHGNIPQQRAKKKSCAQPSEPRVNYT